MVVATSIANRNTSPRSPSPPSLQLALTAARLAEENRGRDVVVLDMRELTPMFDYFVIATGTSSRQMRAMSDEIDHGLDDLYGEKPLSSEGYSGTRWFLLDYGDVVVHLFDEETRRFYALEELWGGAKRVPREAGK